MCRKLISLSVCTYENMLLEAFILQDHRCAMICVEYSLVIVMCFLILCVLVFILLEQPSIWLSVWDNALAIISCCA